jgi:hypothetical protein
MYDFFSMPGVYIDNRGQFFYFFLNLFALGGSPTPHPISLPTSFVFLIPFSYIFRGLDFGFRISRTDGGGGGGASYSISPLSVSLFCVCETGPEGHKSAKHVSIMNWVGWGEVIVHVLYSQSRKSVKHFLQKIREKLKIVRAIFDVFSRYQLDSGQTSPAIFKPFEMCLSKFCKSKIAGEHLLLS